MAHPYCSRETNVIPAKAGAGISFRPIADVNPVMSDGGISYKEKRISKMHFDYLGNN